MGISKNSLCLFYQKLLIFNVFLNRQYIYMVPNISFGAMNSPSRMLGTHTLSFPLRRQFILLVSGSCITDIQCIYMQIFFKIALLLPFH